MTRDHNLLFGVFAVQLGKVTPVQLMDVASSWASDTSRDLPSRLLELKILSQSDRDLLERLVNEAVAAHGGDVEKTLTSFGGEEQVHRTYRGSIVLTADGQVSIPPRRETPAAGHIEADEPGGASGIKGVFETPGRYTELHEYGRGGMGRVLLVHDDFLGRDIALKELLPHLGEMEEYTTLDKNADPDGLHPSPIRFSAHILARFLQEARITGQLEHPSIVPVYELGHRHDGSLYYTMKLVRGRSLSKALSECKNLVERLRYLPHFVDLCQAIAYAHSRKIIHRDIKPANVMVGEFGETVVLDWGLAKKRDREDVHEQQIAETILAMNLGDDVAAAKTAYGQILGTPTYMAPEQAKGDLAQVDEQSDVYALGVVLYEILTGKVPFEGKSTREILNKVIAGDLVPVESCEAGIPPELAAIAAKAMRNDKSGRYGDVKALADEVQRFQSGAMVQAHHYSLADYSRLMWNRNKPLIVTVSIAVGVLIVVSAGYLIQVNQSNRALSLARDQSDRSREHAERESYRSSILLARSYVESNQSMATRQLLHQIPEESRNWEWGYLYNSLDRSAQTFTGHIRPIVQATFSPDGKSFVTASHDGYAKVFDVESGEELLTLAGHTSELYSAEYSPDGSRIVTAARDNTARIWDATNGLEINRLGGHEYWVCSATFSPDGSRVLTTSWDRTARVWDSKTGAEVLRLDGHGYCVTDGDFSSDGTRIATACGDGKIKIWDAASGTELLTFRGHENWVSSVAFDPDGTRVVSTAYGKSASVWAADTGIELHALTGHRAPLFSADFSPDGTRIVTASRDSAVKIWDAKTGKEVLTLAGHGHWVTSAAFSPDGNDVLSASRDKTVKIWDLTKQGEYIYKPKLEAGWAMLKMAWSPNGERLAVIGEEGGCPKIIDATTGERLMELSNCSAHIAVSAYSPDGTHIATGNDDGNLTVWDATTGEVLLDVDAHGYQVGINAVAYSPDGERLATGSNDNTATLWDGATGNGLTHYTGHTGPVLGLSFSPNGDHFATASKDGTVRLWSIRSAKELLILEASNGSAAQAVDFDSTGERIVAAYADNTARVWNVRNGKQLMTLSAHTGEVVAAEFSPDDTRVLTASIDGTAKLWDSGTGMELLALDKHEKGLSAAHFSPDGTRIVTMAQDQSARLYTSIPWRRHAWLDPSTQPDLLLPAQREIPEIDVFRLSGDSIPAQNQLDELADTIRLFADATNSQESLEVAERGDHDALPGLSLNPGDFLVRINGKNIKSVKSVTDKFEEFSAELQETPARMQVLRLDFANYLHYRTVVLYHASDDKPLVDELSDSVNAWDFDARAGGGGTRHLGGVDEQEAHSELADYSRGIELDPGNGYIYTHRGFLLECWQKYEDALIDYDRGGYVAPNYYRPLRNAARVMEEIGDLKGAVENYSKYIAIRPKEDAGYFWRAGVKWKQGDRKGALVDLNEACTLAPDDAYLLSQRARMRQDLGDLEGAQVDLNSALELEPDNAELLTLRARVRQNLGDLEGAESDRNRVRELGPSVRDNRLNFELTDITGRRVALDDGRFAGKVLLVDIWGSWCPPCIAESPHLVKLYEKYRSDGFEIIGVAFERNDTDQVRKSQIEEFAKEHGIAYTLVDGWAHGDEVEKVFPDLQDFNSFPTAILIDRTGKVRDLKVGFSEGMEIELEEAIKSILE